MIGIPASAQVIRQLTDFRSNPLYPALAIDDLGTTVATVTSGDPAGTNPDGERRALIWDLSTQTPSTPGSVTSIAWNSISITDDGQTVAFISTDDPFGTNQDRSPELFVMNVDGSGAVQATFNPSFRREGVKAARISGDGSRVVLLADMDPFGSNASGPDALFSYTLATSTLIQLTPTALQEFETFDVSDDGARVAFVADASFYVVNGGGGGLSRRSTVGDPPVLISGDGQWVTFRQGSFHRRTPWTGGAIESLSTPTQINAVGIADDAQWLYGWLSDEICRIGIFSNATEIIESPAGVLGGQPRFAVAGGSQRIARVKYDGAAPPGYHAFGTIEADGSGETLVATPPFDIVGSGIRHAPWLSQDGTRVGFSSGSGLAVAETDGSVPPLLVPYLSDFPISIPDDGSFIAFSSDAELIPGTSCNGLYSLYTVAADGSGLTSLGPYDSGCPTDFNGAPNWVMPRVTRDGSTLFFGDGWGVLKMPISGSPISTVYEPPTSSVQWDWRLARDGGWVTAEEFRVRADGTDEQVWEPSLAVWSAEPSADGSRIAFYVRVDPLVPPDLSQVFVWDELTGTQQITFSAERSAASPKLSGDGTVISYRLPKKDSWQPAVDDWLIQSELMWMELGGGPARRLTGPRDRLRSTSPGSYDLSADGRTIVFAGADNPVGRNPDHGNELFVVDLDRPARIAPGAPAPTVVSWDVEPSPLLYDVIRGDVANLQSGGPTVDLGPVVCVENDSPDANTVGSEDALQPASGQVFFYLYRGIGDIDVGTGSYGTSSDGNERTTAAGDCSTVVL